MNAPSSATCDAWAGSWLVRLSDFTMTLRYCAREIATLMRLRLRRNSIPRGTSSRLDEVIDKIATAACFALELVDRTDGHVQPCLSQFGLYQHSLRVVGRHHDEV